MKQGLLRIEDAVKTVPDNAEVQDHNAVALAESGDRSGAQAILQKLTASNSNSPVIEDAKKYLQKISR